MEESDEDIDIILQNKKELDKKIGKDGNKDKKPQTKSPQKPLPKSPAKPTQTKTLQEKPRKQIEDGEFIVGKKVSAHDETEGEPSVKTKHIFEINIEELNNFAILKKIIKEINRGNTDDPAPDSKYIQDVFVKYIFPLDDEQIVSDYIQYSPKSESSFDYKVSMHSYHNYVLEPAKSISESLTRASE